MSNEPIIVQTEYNPVEDCWMYKLSDGTIRISEPGDARVPVGLPLNEYIQLAANRIRSR